MNTNKIKCPYCEREHNILRKDGKLRKKIHCKCKDWTKSHTLIWWVTGAGYYVTGKNMELISVD